MNFKHWLLRESDFVHRIDNEKISDFTKNLRTYHRSSDWTSSGTYESDEEIPEGWEKEIGLFAGEINQVVPYATPRGTTFVTYVSQGKPTVAFDISDKTKIMNHKPYLSSFGSSSFKKVGNSEEYFSSNPETISSQQQIDDPIALISKYYNVVFVPNIKNHINDLKLKGIHLSGENIDK